MSAALGWAKRSWSESREPPPLPRRGGVRPRTSRSSSGLRFPASERKWIVGVYARPSPSARCGARRGRDPSRHSVVSLWNCDKKMDLSSRKKSPEFGPWRAAVSPAGGEDSP
ncbi:uncharacterized protein LOC144298308 isoform X2 [Canis aureus]